MTTLIYKFFPIFFLMALGAILGRKGFFTVEMIDGLKKIVASIALPTVLFSAFAQVTVDRNLVILALGIYAACGVMGLIGHLISQFFRLPRPSTAFLFQGFEAGMLGYGLFMAFFSQDSLGFFAMADLGQVVFVFTALMTQLRRSETGLPIRPLLLARSMLFSPVIIAIIAGLLASVVLPSGHESPWSEGGALQPLLTTMGALTTPLICLVVGFGLKDFQIKGAGQALVVVTVRLVSAAVVGTLVAFPIVSWFGLPRIQLIAVLFLFLLPPPFVIPVFRKAKEDASFISSVLSIHTVVSIIATAILAAVAG